MELPVTKEQAMYLNLVARTARLYRITVDRVRRDMEVNEERIAKGTVPTGMRPNDVVDLATSAAQLDMLEAGLFTVFADGNGVEYGKLVRGYFRTAMKAADHDFIIPERATEETK